MRYILSFSQCTFSDGKLRGRSSVHARVGHLQRFKCVSCKAMLCKNPRLWVGKQESCFSLFHTVSKEELAILVQNLCACPNPAHTACVHMLMLEPQLQERRAQTSNKILWQDRKTCHTEACAVPAIYNTLGVAPKF